jgi:hypothetical protein
MWVVLSLVCKDVAVLESRALLATKWIERTTAPSLQQFRLNPYQ